MSKRVVTTTQADRDIESVVAYYVQVGAHDAALDFVDELEKATGRLSTHPSIGSSRLAVEIGIDEVRTISVQRFPFILVYTEDAGAVRIHRVLHTSRDIHGLLADD